MSEERASALQLCPLSAHLEAGLSRRFAVIRWFELDGAAQAEFLGRQARSVRAVITGGHIGCSNGLIEALPSLGIITINGVGTDKVDLGLARQRSVRVTSTPGLLTEDVADLAVGLVIALLRAIPAADAYVRAGRWEKGDRPLGRKVSGRRFGIVGLGQIGAAIAARLCVFGPVAYTGPRRKNVSYEFHPDAVALARASNVLVLSCPANESTRHVVGAAVLDALGADGCIINVARGSIIDETALIAALEAGRLQGAALDVFENEPHVPRALRESDKVVLTPHTASATVETRIRMAELVLANLDAFMSGAPLPSAVA